MDVKMTTFAVFDREIFNFVCASYFNPISLLRDIRLSSTAAQWGNEKLTGRCPSQGRRNFKGISSQLLLTNLSKKMYSLTIC